MLCPACGTWSTQADRCSHCGAALAAPPPAPVPVGGSAPQPPASPAPAYGQPAPGQGPYAPANPYAPPQQQMPPAGPYAPYAAQQPHYAQPPMPGTPYPPAPGFPGVAPYPGAPGFAAPGYGWQPPQPFRPLRGLAMSLYVLLGVSAVASVVSAVAYIMRALLLSDLIDDPDSVSGGDADNADNFVTAATGFAGVVLLATGVVFCIWFYRARCNVDLFGPSRQRLAKGWAIGGWFCPVVWWWFPKLIAHDIWKASDAQAAERGGATPGRKPLLWVWWVLLMLAVWSTVAAAFLYPAEDDIVLEDAKDLRLADYVSSGTEVLMVFAAIAAVLVVRRITALQHAREAQAFAAVGQPQEAPGGWSGAPAPFPAAAPGAPSAEAPGEVLAAPSPVPAPAPGPASTPAPSPAPAGPPPMPTVAPTVQPLASEPAGPAETGPDAVTQESPQAAAPSFVKEDVAPAPEPHAAPEPAVAPEPAAEEAASAPGLSLAKEDAAAGERESAPAYEAWADGTTTVTPAVADETPAPAETGQDAATTGVPASAPGPQAETEAEAGTTVLPAASPAPAEETEVISVEPAADRADEPEDAAVPSPRAEAGTMVLPVGSDEPEANEGGDAPRS